MFINFSVETAFRLPKIQPECLFLHISEKSETEKVLLLNFLEEQERCCFLFVSPLVKRHSLQCDVGEKTLSIESLMRQNEAHGTLTFHSKNKHTNQDLAVLPRLHHCSIDIFVHQTLEGV